MTNKQEQVYEIIKQFIDQNGYSPSIREIMKLMGLSSPATIHSHLCKLKEKGYITYVPDTNRTIRIIK